MRFDCLWLRAGKLDLWAENTGVYTMIFECLRLRAVLAGPMSREYWRLGYEILVYKTQEQACWTCEQRILEFIQWNFSVLDSNQACREYWSLNQEILVPETHSRHAGPVSREYWSLYHDIWMLDTQQACWTFEQGILEMRFDCLWLRADKLDLWTENTDV